MNERIESIQKMLRDNPDDVFLRYSLAMEYAAIERYEEAVAAFQHCMELDADYLAAYVEAGKCLRAAGKLDKARETFAAAMELAAMQGEPHARDFIQQQLDALPRED